MIGAIRIDRSRNHGRYVIPSLLTVVTLKRYKYGAFQAVARYAVNAPERVVLGFLSEPWGTRKYRFAQSESSASHFVLQRMMANRLLLS
ncbi:MAG: hypothetical protein ACR2QU_08300 [Gammaproteobacteria bacterium]